jgi:SAM-dependent methyltransferase
MTTEEQRQGWRSVADGWGRRRGEMWEATQPVSERMVELLAPQPGDTVLELAGGSGDTGFLAAERIGRSGRLIESDFVEEIVHNARRRGAELELENAEFQVIDAEAIGLPDESVDGVLCRWGFMLASDPAAALAETRRVLRPNGRVAFAVWGTPDENLWASTVGRVLVEHGLVPPPEPDTPGPFRLGDRERVKALVAGAGLDLAAHEDLEVEFRYDDADDFWETTLDVSQALRAAAASGDVAAVAAARTDLGERLEAFRAGDSIVMTGVTQIVLARRV